MPAELYLPNQERGLGDKQLLHTYPDEKFEPHRAFLHALGPDHKGYPIEFRPDPMARGYMQTFGDERTAKQVATFIAKFEDSTLFRFFRDVYEGNPIPLEAYLRQTPVADIYPDATPQIEAPISYGVVQLMFVRAYERNMPSVETQHPLKQEMQFRERYRISQDPQLRNVYDNCLSRAVTGSNSNDFPYVAYELIDQLTRQNPELRIEAKN